MGNINTVNLLEIRVKILRAFVQLNSKYINNKTYIVVHNNNSLVVFPSCGQYVFQYLKYYCTVYSIQS